MPDFPRSYVDSRARFRQAAHDMGAEQHSFPLKPDADIDPNIDGITDLSVDIALVGPVGRSLIVMSSGLHGVEAPVGAAIQLAWMVAHRQLPIARRYLLVHALNPYGYAAGRRVNESNVDLNRNFLNSDLFEAGMSHSMMFDTKVTRARVSDYARFDPLLNPSCPPRRVDGFYFKALGHLAREGTRRLQGAIVTGQYEFPRGLFYGGRRRSFTAQLLHDQIHHWVGCAAEICHLDFHTGLGRFADCQLLVDPAPGSSEHQWYAQAFGATDVVSTAPVDTNAYQACGAMGSWLTQHLDDRAYRFLTAEFGTYASLTVLSALRKENQAFHHTDPNSAARALARRRLEHCFCPSSSRWRNKVIARGLELVEQASGALS